MAFLEPLPCPQKAAFNVRVTLDSFEALHSDISWQKKRKKKSIGFLVKIVLV